MKRGGFTELKRGGLMQHLVFRAALSALVVSAFVFPDVVRAQTAAETSIVVLELRAASSDDARLAQLLSDALATGVGKAHKGPVVSQREVLSRIDAAAQQALMGCTDDKCVFDLSKALAVDQAVSGRVGVLNGQVLIFLSLLSMKDGAVLARTSLSLPAGDKHLAEMVEQSASTVLPKRPTTVMAMEQAAHQLFVEDNGRTADQKLTDLRIAVLFDELKADGGEMVGRPVEGCVEAAFREAGADIVSGVGVAQLKGTVGPRTLLQGGVPATLDAGDIDVLVVGVIEYETSRNETLGVYSTGAALTLSLMKIDTAEVIANASPRGKGTGHGAQEAQRASAEAVCKQVQPALQEALASRVRRGERIVVEVRGIDGLTGATAVVEMLAKQKSVGRAKLRRTQADRAIIDVVVKGGDGIALALELATVAGSPRVLEAGPAALKLVIDKPVSATDKKAKKTSSG